MLLRELRSGKKTKSPGITERAPGGPQRERAGEGARSGAKDAKRPFLDEGQKIAVSVSGSVKALLNKGSGVGIVFREWIGGWSTVRWEL